jgi:predicted methyltransferase
VIGRLRRAAAAVHSYAESPQNVPKSLERGGLMRAVLVALACLPLAGAPPSFAQPAPAAAGPPYVVPADTPAHVRRGVEAPERTAEQRARDYFRKPAEIMTLSALEEGDRIVEIAAFGQYFTTMLLAAVGPAGRVDMYDLPYTERMAGEASRAFAARHPNAAYHLQDYNDVVLPQGVDSVWNVLYYHDLQPQGVDTAAFNRKIFAALKPGGRYIVVDHKAEDGSGWRDAATIHRMGVETIEQEVLAAGFELALESDLLANPQDDRTKMVFAPGTRGTTDQAFFIFRKPD